MKQTLAAGSYNAANITPALCVLPTSKVIAERPVIEFRAALE
jgi:hypothetical protein